MKILYVACKYDYGKPELGFSFEHYNFYDSLVKMDGGGNKIVYFPFDEIIQRVGREKMNEELLEVVDREKPDICFFVLFEEQFKKEVIKKISLREDTITLNWFLDDLWRFDNFSRYWAPCFNWATTNEPSALKKYQKIGYKNIIESQYACNHFLYKPLNLPKIYDVTFIGQLHGNRKKIIEKIKRAGIKIECFGRGWPNGKISQEEMIKIFSQSKINLNLSACSGKIGLTKAIARIFLSRQAGLIKLRSPKTWFDNFKTFLARQKNEIKGRIFEILGCQTFLLTDYARGLKKYYQLGKEIICFSGPKDLIKKIKYYLANEEKRNLIAKAGYERTIKNHTFEKRFQDMFNVILKNKTWQ